MIWLAEIVDGPDAGHQESVIATPRFVVLTPCTACGGAHLKPVDADDPYDGAVYELSARQGAESTYERPRAYYRWLDDGSAPHADVARELVGQTGSLSGA